ncbi:MAG: hypothetical protein K2R98_27365 [Gemmataceae bacterium]|nr:hypothetical protein [Gemmataceae bacterium]
MTFFKRILAAVVLLLATVVLLLSLAAAIGIWIIKEPVTRQATQLHGRIESALDIADQGLDQAKTSLTRAVERLETTREEQRQLAREPQNPGLRRFMARTVQQRLAPELGDAQAKLHTVAEAAVAINTVLEDMGNFPFLAATGFEGDQLTEINGQLSQVSSSAWELSRLLGDPPTDQDADAVNAQLSRVDSTLKSSLALIARYQPRVAEVRQRAEGIKSKTLTWIGPVAAVISFVFFWSALSQLSMMRQAISWWKRS